MKLSSLGIIDKPDMDADTDGSERDIANIFKRGTIIVSVKRKKMITNIS